MAEQLCRHCDLRQILTSDVVRMLVGTTRGLMFKAIGPLELEGASEPINVYELSREPAPLIGDLPEGRQAFDGRSWVVSGKQPDPRDADRRPDRRPEAHDARGPRRDVRERCGGRWPAVLTAPLNIGVGGK